MNREMGNAREKMRKRTKTMAPKTLRNNGTAAGFCFGNHLFLLLFLIAIQNGHAAEIGGERDSLVPVEAKKHPLARLLLSRFAASQSNQQQADPGFLRRLADKTKIPQASDATIATTNTFASEFGPGADWSCTTPSNNDYDSCTLSSSTRTGKGCYWCPLESNYGTCLSHSQADILGSSSITKHILHLECYGIEDDQIHDSSVAFWEEAFGCRDKVGSGDCHSTGSCAWCTIDEPAMAFCLSKKLWSNLVLAQEMENFDQDLSMGEAVLLNDVIHCSVGETPTVDNTDHSQIEGAQGSLWNDKCNWSPIDGTDNKSVEDCETLGCVVLENPFPGFLGSNTGQHCISRQMEGFIVWAVNLLKEMGWKEEFRSWQLQ